MTRRADSFNDSANHALYDSRTLGLLLLEEVTKQIPDTDKIAGLIGRGADPDICDDAGITPLMHAAWYGSIESIAALLDNGADIHTRDREGDTVLMYAVFKGRLDAVKVLLERGADILAVNNHNKSALDQVDTSKYPAFAAYLRARALDAFAQSQTVLQHDIKRVAAFTIKKSTRK